MSSLNEEIVELAALEWLAETGYQTRFGPDIAPGETGAERASYDEVLLLGRLRAALANINQHIPASARASAIDEAIRKLTRHESTNLIHNNHAFHRLLVEGIDISYKSSSGQTKHDKIWLLNFDQWQRNDWLAVNQFTVTDVNLTSRAKTNRRPDIVLFGNGIPLAVIELKNAADENATLEHAYNQLQTYKDDIPSLMVTNCGLVIADGPQARLGTLTSGIEWFKQWRTIDGQTLAALHELELEVLLKGAFTPYRFLDLIRSFTVFDVDGNKINKKMAAYHQYHAVNKAVDETVKASGPEGDRKVGVVWHTQGSGKSLSMLFYAGKIIQQPDMENPTLIILTDRNDLDDQLFGTFAGGQELLRQQPVQAESRDHLQQLLQVASGGVVFTTIQKFRPDPRSQTFDIKTGTDSDEKSLASALEHPLLSKRRNIIFIADEAHRSQYGFEARLVRAKNNEAYLAYGFAKYVRDALPQASFIGFTGTPIESDDISTPQVFGDYIDVYDIHRAVEDKATVPIFYEARLAKLVLKDEKRPEIDPDFEEITEGRELEEKEKLKSKWSALEAMVGTEERLAQVAADIIAHFEEREKAMLPEIGPAGGKAMIVCMSRRICVDLYHHLIALKPEWHHDEDDKGVLKVVMTGSASDPASYQLHVRNKSRRKALAERFKEPDDPLKLVIVRDMWLTGFDVPPMHTMYLDKPMQGHGLMQAIARVNRVYKNKPGGLIVDYLGIASDLKEAMHTYTLRDEGGEYKTDDPTSPISQAASVMRSQYEVVKAFFQGQHRFDYSPFFQGTPSERLRVIPAAMEHVLKQPDGKKRYMEAVARLSKAFALAVPHPDAIKIRDEVAFFQAVRAGFAKVTPGNGKTQAEVDFAIQQLVSEAVASPEVINIFDAAGLPNPDISILSDKFLAEVQNMPQKNLALEMLRKLLNDEIKARARKNAVQARSFEEMMEVSILRYQNRTIDTAEVISELINIAQDMKRANKRGEALGLSDEELAFYDALAANESAVEVMGDKQLAFIAHELMKMIRKTVTIDWTERQSARAKIRVMVKRILKKYGYPPDMQETATDTVLEQAELIAADWAI
ncbi:MAG: type I restriction endonuclease subunit R [Ardenticatenaceae bacterium]|nr:type I restriction endonuclease subunit R [Ardenticatenaceae bacterium]